MDGITEPVVLVLGHPIAGNPAQFALERAFEAMKLPWRVLSCDVPPERVDEAISGAEVLGFRGLLLDQNLSTDHSDPCGQADLYWRSSKADDHWHSENVLTTWLQVEIRNHVESSAGESVSLLWIGTPDPRFPTELTTEQTRSPIAWASTEAIEHADLIAITEAVDFSQWPPCQNDTLVLDFANPQNDTDPIAKLGYKILGWEQARIGILVECIRRWTGQQATTEVLNDAVEEYLAV